MTGRLLDFLKEQDVEYSVQFDISRASHIKIGGKAACAALPNGTGKLIKLVDFLKEENIPYRLVGAMSNVLPRDTDYSGVLLITQKCDGYYQAENKIVLECGVKISKILPELSRRGLCGMESLFAIPGTVGGMIYSNAGAYGATISDRLLTATVYSPKDKKISVLKKCDMDFSYRHSALIGTDNILLSAEFLLFEDNPSNIAERIAAVAKSRRAAQPYNMPSLGSVFKRSADLPISLLIDELGLKGLSVGGAQVSEKHAGFIVNTGSATQKDFLELVTIIKNKVYEKYGIIPEEEIELF